MADYNEDPYQHVISSVVGQRLLVVNIAGVSHGFVSIAGAEPYDFIVNGFGYRLFDAGFPSGAIVLSNSIDTEQSFSDSIALGVDEFLYSLSGRTLEEVILSDEYITDVVRIALTDVIGLGGGRYFGPSFSGPVITFDQNGGVTSETNPTTGVTIIHDPPV